MPNNLFGDEPEGEPDMDEGEQFIDPDLQFFGDESSS
jgi:hypothetical protein